MLRNLYRLQTIIIRHGLRQYSDKAAVGSSVVNKHVSESDIEAMFEYSVQKSKISDNWPDAMDVITKAEEVFPLDKPTKEQLLNIRASRPTMTLASLVPQSKTLQNLVDLGVALHKWDEKGKLPMAAKLDFDRDVAPLVRLLADITVSPDVISHMLTRNPELLEEPLEDIQVRLNYLAIKNFSKDAIVTLISESPKWLSLSVKQIDARLGFFQKTFDLTGGEVRHLAVSDPGLITWVKTPVQIRRNLFCLNEEMGFSKEELKMIVLACPHILFKKDEKMPDLLRQFELLHNVIKYPHSTLAKFPISLCRKWYNTEPRHLFLQSLGRAQYDPNLPNYVNPGMLTELDDVEFSEDVAKVHVGLYNQFLKTL